MTCYFVGTLLKYWITKNSLVTFVLAILWLISLYRNKSTPDIAPAVYRGWRFIEGGGNSECCTIGNFCSETIVRAKSGWRYFRVWLYSHSRPSSAQIIFQHQALRRPSPSRNTPQHSRLKLPICNFLTHTVKNTQVQQSNCTQMHTDNRRD